MDGWMDGWMDGCDQLTVVIMNGCDQLTVVIMKIIRINHSYPIKGRIHVRNELEMVIFKIEH